MGYTIFIVLFQKQFLHKKIYNLLAFYDNYYFLKGESLICEKAIYIFLLSKILLKDNANIVTAN